ncbi:DUF58 domain-containing protein [Tessaracoccus sp. OH4464_COT-324]|uniref:DUF58 domain-containing protein n=1 Tax=Tessaracoccus sp. OH4464_COT-324 TaxID=2491059 RepID=UPI000F62DC0D|nr:DUF58 domain-containing protein [Tessaracoccus sp. OH4464_COT-324]RRD47552.1 DUF58 domain-containing protein [Tessaracoccus sp. OH4464_COT-324]
MSIRFTSRGTSLLVGGALFVLSGLYLGERDFLAVGLVLVFLPVIALLLTFLLRKVHFQRIMSSTQVCINEPLSYDLQITKPGLGSICTAVITDVPHPPLRGGGTLRVNQLRPWSEVLDTFRLRSSIRGRFRLAAPIVEVLSPLNLAARSIRALGEENTLRVAPRVWPLPALAAGGPPRVGAAGTGKTGLTGDPDVLVREHREGDGMRKVHWRLSAKRDELMVRLDDAPLQPSSTVLLDLRRSAHLGNGASSSMEWSISASTSIGLRLLSEKHRLRILGGSGLIFSSSDARGDQHHQLLETAIDLQADDGQRLSDMAGHLTPLPSTSRLIACTGLLSVDDAEFLATIGERLTAPVLFAPDPGQWGSDIPAHRSALDSLRLHGWLCHTHGTLETVPSVLQALTHKGKWR